MRRDEREPRAAAAYLSELREETMLAAWGKRSQDERRRIISAAIIFGEQFEERAAESLPSLEESDRQRFLMELINAVIREFARRENLDEQEAAAFLSDAPTRDCVLEFNEVLEEHASAPQYPLDGLLNRAVENRRDRAIWASHFRSG